MVQAGEPTPEALLEALKDGQFYSSQGPTIEHVGIDGDRVIVRCSPARSIHAAGRPPLNRYVHAESGQTITEASFSIEAFAGESCRITVVDERGRRAWTNPFWLDAWGPGIG